MKNKNIVIAGIIILSIICLGLWLYYSSDYSVIQVPIAEIELQRQAILSGTPEQKEQALTKFMDAVYAEEINFSSAKHLIPAIIEATLDDTPLPWQEDTGWGHVYHQAASAMRIFAYKTDGIDRNQDTAYSFFASGGIADENTRKQVHDNWLQWWNENKDKIQ